VITGPQIRLEIGRIADGEFVHRTCNHLQHLIGDVILQKQQAQAPSSAARRS